jgi:hypothetical protein
LPTGSCQLLGKSLQRLRSLWRPPAAAGDDERALGRQQQFPQSP